MKKRKKTLRKKFNIGVFFIIMAGLFLLVNLRYIGRAAEFAVVERKHLALVEKLTQAIIFYENNLPQAKKYPKKKIEEMVREAHAQPVYVLTRVFGFELQMMGLMGFPDLRDLPYKGVIDLKVLVDVVENDPNPEVTPTLIKNIRATLPPIFYNSNRFALILPDFITFMNNLAFAINIGGILIFIGTFLIMRAHVLFPLGRIMEMVSHLQEGHLEHRLQMENQDEMGDIARTLDKLADDLTEILSGVNQSTGTLVENAESLSQIINLGELSESVGTIAQRASENSDNALKANDLSVSVSIHAAEGNKQMDQMVLAVDEINDSSDAISKIIKTIDELAFQTNLLALNAAVEAARAGDAGKGFAVVAEEVKNLATRSAKAAQETTGLIEHSRERMGKGGEITQKTAEVLKNIVEGVNEVSKIIQVIAESSETQSRETNQVNHTLENLAGTAKTSGTELMAHGEKLKSLLNRFSFSKKNNPQISDK